MGTHRKVPCLGGCGKLIRVRKTGMCPDCLYPKRPLAATPAAFPSDGISIHGDIAHLAKITPVQVQTLDKLIEVCEIDLSTWEIERWVANKWEMGSKSPDGKPITTPLYQIKVWLKRKSRTILTQEKLAKELLDDIRNSAPKPTTVRHRFVNGGWLMEFAPFDLHLGKHAWGDESVTNYDSNIAVDLFNAALDYLLARACKATDGKLERILCVFGNDVTHIDAKSGQTTGGTPMDVDTRYIKVYRRAVSIHRRAINILREIAPVDVVIVPGNHDELTSFHLGEILFALYEKDKHVKVNNAPRLRKYYEFGTNLLGFTHGHSERVSELPLLMAREQPDAWARCESREWHIGHKHVVEKFTHAPLVQDLFSDKGVRIRRLTSMSGHDAWHTKHAYTDRRACESFIFHKTAGFSDLISFNIDHFTGEALNK